MCDIKMLRIAWIIGLCAGLIILDSGSAGAGRGRDVSISGILDSRGPIVDILYPTEQEIFPGGSTIPFQWTLSDANPGQDPGDYVATVTIDGNDYDSFPFTYGNDLYEWQWIVPEIISANCRLRVTARDHFGNVTNELSGPFTIVLATTEVSPGTPTVPMKLALGPAHPNPFNPSTEIAFDLPTSGEIVLAVYDLLGRRVRRLAHGSWPAGRHAVVWDGLDDSWRRSAGGVYLVRLTFAGPHQRNSLVHKVVMVP